MLGNFNEETQLILLKAKEEMQKLHHPYIGTEHLVLSILKNEKNLKKRLKTYGLTYENFKEEILKTIGMGTKESEFQLHTPLLKKVIENAILDAKDNNNGEVTIEHLLSSLLEIGEGIAIRIFISMNINLDQMYEEFSYKLIKKTKKRKKKLIVEELGTDLTSKLENNKTDPVIGREEELERLIEILCRRTKNNPILIGDAGVGKTAIVEELARRIKEGEVPNHLQNKKIISIDMATIVSGTKYRGEFEERMQKLIKEVSEEGNIIMFIDEIHTLVGAGGAEGAIDASNILKPALARGKIRCIGATTTKEYKKYIEEDKALERRFQKIIVEEPSKEKTITILKKLKPIYEHYHQVKIPEEVLKQIVELSENYIFDRHNPDKSIDILDEACSMVGVKETKEEEKIRNLKKEINKIKKEKNDLLLDNDIKKAYNLLKKENELTSYLNKLQLTMQKKEKKVTNEDIAKILNKKTNIPIYEILKDKSENIEKLIKKLKSEIIGQDNAIDLLAQATKRINLGYSDHKIKSFLFTGPTGVGKTKLAKIYSEYVAGENNLIKMDMSEYADATAINKIIGASPGYVGFGENNTIISKLKEKPSSVILLDEIDKSHPTVINLLYQILDEGKITDAKNNTVDLNHHIIIMTSNLGFEEQQLGFQKENTNNIKNKLKETFPPSLINRIDNIITFNHLTRKDMTKIIKKKLLNLKLKYKDLTYSNNIIDELIEQSEYEEYGARQLEKIIDNKLENIILDKLLNHEELIINSFHQHKETV